ncbi:MAG: hypothetical protein PHT53_02900, partial [Candidatus Omnitrophica bacterium]|nr:hypothetical protein [Candidatus Omnitrophota bacterium]
FDISNNNIPDNEFSHNQPYVNQSYIDYMEKKDANHTFTFDELLALMPAIAYLFLNREQLITIQIRGIPCLEKLSREFPGSLTPILSKMNY